MFKYENLTPFQLYFCCNNFPFIEETFDDLTTYKILCKIVDYLQNEIIPNIDNIGNSQNELIEKFNELKSYVDNYFTNLDVQEEINKKLDEMVETGYFDNLLTNYLKIIKIYKTTIEMILDAENLEKGQIIKTLGYYEINDDGPGYFYITDEKSEQYQINLENGLFATLIIENDILNVKTIGAKGDNITDDTNIIQNAINNAIINKYNVFLPSGIYLVTGLLINEPIKIYGTRDSIIKNTSNNNTITINQPRSSRYTN